MVETNVPGAVSVKLHPNIDTEERKHVDKVVYVSLCV